MSPKPHLFVKIYKAILFTFLLSLSSQSFAEGTIEFLGVDTEILDREVRDGELLGTILSEREIYCENKVANITHNKPAKEAKKRRKAQAKCLKKFVKSLYKSKKRDDHEEDDDDHNDKKKDNDDDDDDDKKGHGDRDDDKKGHDDDDGDHKKSRIITKSEYKLLKSIIKDFKKNGPVSPPPPPPVVLMSTIKGLITTPSGVVVPNVTISDGQNPAVLATSTANGTFSLTLEADKQYVLRLSADGFASQVVPVKSPTVDGVITLDFTMIAQGAIQTFDAITGGTLSGSDGASVTIGSGTLVDTTGQIVTGNVDLTITPVDVSNGAIIGAFPGSFTGIQTDTTETPIISFGTVEYKFSQNGQPLQLAAGSTADILIPIYISTYQDGSDIQVGDVIPLWSLNETTGIWLQEGTGTVVTSTSSPTGLAMNATVSHFTWWNCDVSMNAAKAIVTVTGINPGTAVIMATTTANIGGRPGTVDAVTDIGTPTAPLNIPSQVEVCFKADLTYVDGSTGTTPQSCITAGPNATVNISLSAAVVGPLDIQANSSDGPLNVTGIIGAGYPISKINLYPITAETSVTYTVISGTLPAGISLNTTGATKATITGVPTEAGDFVVIVEANDGTEVDTVTINFSIIDPATSSLPVFVNNLIYFPIFTGGEQFDLNPYNVGGASTDWSLREALTDVAQPVPTWFSLSPLGILTVSNNLPVFDDWTGTLIASTSAGIATTAIRLCTGDCGGSVTPIPGDYALTISDTSVREGTTRAGISSSMSIDLTLNQISGSDISVNYTTSDGTAIAGADYTATSGTAIIPAGSTSFTIIVPVIDDLDQESNESFTLTLSNPVGARIERGAANCRIIDNDTIFLY